MATTFEPTNKHRGAKPIRQDWEDGMDPEVAALRDELARAKERALEAEAALPHLLGLGQTTVNEILDDARAHAAAIVQEAQARVAAEEAVLDKARAQLETLYMAIAAEAAALEQLRRQTASEGIETNLNTDKSSRTDAVVAAPDQVVEDESQEIRLEELDSIPTSDGFAKAWGEDDDASLVEAFARFFNGDTEGIDPSRRWIMDEPDS